MDSRVLLFLFVVSSFWCCHARDLTVQLQSDKLPAEEAQQNEVSRNENLCTLCVEFASEALNYLSENKTQTEIITVLHKTCSKIPSFEQQCIVLVDYYAPLFFLEASSVQAEGFCQKVALCETVSSVPQKLPKETCEICQYAVAEALVKLKDPDSELEIVQLLLKACDKFEKAVKKCKRLVFVYAPLILVNAEQFLETNDICTMLHVCDPAAFDAEQSLPEIETSTHAES